MVNSENRTFGAACRAISHGQKLAGSSTQRAGAAASDDEAGEDEAGGGEAGAEGQSRRRSAPRGLNARPRKPAPETWMSRRRWRPARRARPARDRSRDRKAGRHGREAGGAAGKKRKIGTRGKDQGPKGAHFAQSPTRGGGADDPLKGNPQRGPAGENLTLSINLTGEFRGLSLCICTLAHCAVFEK